MFKNNLWLLFGGLLLVSLFFTVTNLIPLSLAFGFFLVALPFLFWSQTTLPPLVLSVTLLFVYFAAWVLLYDPAAFLSYTFYRRDGNVFATLMPILLFGLFALQLDLERILKVFSYFATSINFLCLFLFLTSFQIVGQSDNPEKNCYCFLFLTHNAAGGFLANLFAISLALWLKDSNCLLKERSFFHLFCVIINSVGLYLSHSRGSILAVILAIGMTLFFKEKHVKKIVWASILTTVLLLAVTYPMWVQSGKFINYVSADSNAIESAASAEFERSYTFFDRALFLWPRAFDLWLSSPLIGTGYGSYNDIPYELKGIDNIVMMNFPHDYTYSDAHAHHTFLHVASETGLVGLLLVIWMLVLQRRFILSLESSLLKCALALMFWISVWSSMTEHRLFTPSQMLPFTILLGLALGKARNTREIAVKVYTHRE